MQLVKINAQSYINPDQVISVNFLPDKLKTIVVCVDRVIVESDFPFEETKNVLSIS